MKYTPEFKQQVADQYKRSGNMTQTCRKFNISLTSFRNWGIKEYKKNDQLEELHNKVKQLEDSLYQISQIIINHHKT